MKLILLAVLPFLVACSSLYSRSYTQITDPLTSAQAPRASTTQVVIVTRTENLQRDVKRMQAKMYVPFGYSRFFGEPEPDAVLVAFAERIGATTVLVSSSLNLNMPYARPGLKSDGTSVRAAAPQESVQDKFEHVAVFMVQTIRKPRLGVEMRDLRDDERNSSLGVQGALIEFVMEDTPASRGKLLAGDVIVEVKGTAVRNAAHFQKIIELLPSEELKLPLTLIRDGSRRQIDVTF